MVKRIRIRRRTTRRRAPKKMTMTRGLRLDSAAAAYARLLADPCEGPLVNGPFGDGSGGIVTRFEYDAIINTSTGETGAFYAFSPAQAYGFLTPTILVSDSTAFTAVANTAYSPAYSFMLGNASQYRCLSACLQITYPGTEFSRMGVVSLGQFPQAVAGGATTTSKIRAASRYVERTPQHASEIIWRPNNYDLEWSAPAISDAPTASKGTCLIATLAGGASSLGIRVRVVCVYEWLPTAQFGSGLVVNTSVGVASSNTFQDVVRTLDSFGDWMYRGALKVGSAADGILRGLEAATTMAYGEPKNLRHLIMSG